MEILVEHTAQIPGDACWGVVDEHTLPGKNGCVLIRKKVYGVGARRDGWSRPLALAVPRPMSLKA